MQRYCPERCHSWFDIRCSDGSGRELQELEGYFSDSPKWRKRSFLSRIASGPISRGALDNGDPVLVPLTDDFFVTGTGYAIKRAQEMKKSRSPPEDWRSQIGEQLCIFFEQATWVGYACPQCGVPI